MSDDWKGRLLMRSTKTGAEIRPVVANVVTILGNDSDWDGVLAFDAFGESIVALKRPPWHEDDAPAHFGLWPADWSDEDDTRVTSWLSRKYNVHIGVQLVREAVGVVAHRRRVHPVLDWLSKLTWDSVNRLDSWMVECFGAEDTPYVREVGGIFLKSAVARVMRPGCKVDTVVILEGPQGIGKSTAIRELVGEPYFLETGVELGTKDSFQQLRRKWLVELAELDSLSRAEVSRVKAFLSARVDTYRSSYGRRAADHPRQCVFVGTTNAGSYLKDDSGARRFLPVRCGKIDLWKVRTLREQLWAEARVRVEKHEPWHVQDAALVKAFEAEQDARFQVDPWEQAIAAYVTNAGHSERRVEGVTTSDVLEGALDKDKGNWARADEMRVGAVLRRLGWEPIRHPTTRNGARVRPYRPCSAQLVHAVVLTQDRENSTSAQHTQPAHPLATYVRANGGSSTYGSTQQGRSCSSVVQDDEERAAIVAEGSAQ